MPEHTTLKEFITDLALYQPVALESKHLSILLSLLYSGTLLDMHCPDCKKDRPFKLNPNSQRTKPAVAELTEDQGANFLGDKYFTTSLSCTWSGSHSIVIYWALVDRKLQKIGQLPSLADLALPIASKYAKQIDSALRNELHKAIGLAAHGVGIGSFAYLRRVFERMLDKHRLEADPKGTDIANYERMRVDEKIEALKAVLPAFLVKHAKIYGLLSKGIHELSEEECLEAFPAIRNGIILILEQDFQEEERKRIEVEASKAISSLSSKYSS
jgi:hypothetical protein